jgi:ribosomal protein L2
MALKQFNPTSPGRRFMTALTFDEITKDRLEEPHRTLRRAAGATTAAASRSGSSAVATSGATG